MPTVRLTWSDNNTAETGHEIFRATTPFDLGTLPSPIAILGEDVTAYDDIGVDPGTYYYAVAATAGTGKFLSELVLIKVGLTQPQDPLPGGTEFMAPIILTGI